MPTVRTENTSLWVWNNLMKGVFHSTSWSLAGMYVSEVQQFVFHLLDNVYFKRQSTIKKLINSIFCFMFCPNCILLLYCAAVLSHVWVNKIIFSQPQLWDISRNALVSVNCKCQLGQHRTHIKSPDVQIIRLSVIVHLKPRIHLTIYFTIQVNCNFMASGN